MAAAAGRAEAEERRERELSARTIDVVRIGDPAPNALTASRASARGGQVPRPRMAQCQRRRLVLLRNEAPAGQTARLLCTYWGDDAGPREFDVQVDGTTIATQKLARNKPGQFFDVEYPLPAQRHGRQRITVKFLAHPNCMAGGVFGLRVIKTGRE